MADKKKGASKDEAPKEEARGANEDRGKHLVADPELQKVGGEEPKAEAKKDEFPHEKQAEAGGVAAGNEAAVEPEQAVQEDRIITTDKDGNEVVQRMTETAYPKQMWIEESYDLLRLPAYVVAAVLEKDDRTEFTLTEVKNRLGIIS